MRPGKLANLRLHGHDADYSKAPEGHYMNGAIARSISLIPMKGAISPPTP
jgi:hypothetical protein